MRKCPVKVLIYSPAGSTPRLPGQMPHGHWALRPTNCEKGGPYARQLSRVQPLPVGWYWRGRQVTACPYKKCSLMPQSSCQTPTGQTRPSMDLGGVRFYPTGATSARLNWNAPDVAEAFFLQEMITSAADLRRRGCSIEDQWVA